MAKRSVEVEDGNQAYLKRQKIKHATTSSAESVQSATQLRQLLAFDQDAGRAKHGIQSFKTFLDKLGDDSDQAEAQDTRKASLSLLREYLVTQLPKDEEDKAFSYLADVMQTWSFAAQSNNESLLSAVPALLALLMKTISGALDLVEYGLRLGRTLLQKRQLELLARGMSSIKTKEYVISPSIRLLREVTVFDGGALAKQVFRSREFTLKSLARNLGLRYIGDGAETRRKPSVRTNAMRFLLALLKFLPDEGKKELLSQRDITSNITRDINHDPPFLVRDTLETLQTHVIQDEKLLRDTKSKVFNAAGLARIVNLYGYDQQDEENATAKKPIDVLVHELLMQVCTSPNLGVLYRQAGYYPRGVDPNAVSDSRSSPGHIDLGLDTLEWAGRFSNKVPVRNTTLSEFIQTLRPWSSTRQADLLLAIFKAAPELIADYFFGKKSFTFDPKLTATWIGYSAFLFSVVRLPVPFYFGNAGDYGLVPPPTTIVIESILPQPLTQKSLTRCFNQTSPLITFFAVRILIVAFEKLQKVLSGYQDASKTSPLWKQAASQLKEEFTLRCPTMKDTINIFRTIEATNLMQRQAASRLLLMYYTVLPQAALEAKFDVSGSLTHALGLLNKAQKGSEEAAMRVMELENLFEVAHCSPGMRWFHKADSLSISPFTAMLRLLTEATSSIPLLKLRSVLESVIKESGIMQSQTKPPALDALIWALKSATGQYEPNAIYEFVDNCALRCSNTPIKYIEALETLASKVNETVPGSPRQVRISLLLLAIAEQWPFIINASDVTNIEAVAFFIANYLASSMSISEDKKVLKSLIKNMAAEMPVDHPSRKVIEGTRKLVNLVELSEPVDEPEDEEVSRHRQPVISARAEVEASMLQPAKDDLEDHKALLRWTTKQMDEVVEEGHTAALVVLLSSPHLSVRKEAMTNIAKMASKLKESTYDEKEQIWLLLCETMETARGQIENCPLPTTITAFAARALTVLQNPLHPVYPKINKFLSQGPSWDLDKIPLMNSILNESPSLDDAYFLEIDWLLGYLVAALRTPDDLATYHKRHIFEKLLTIYNHGKLPKDFKEKILRVCFQATTVDGGSTTLITRFSILSWIRAQIKLDNKSSRALRVLMEMILETCDETRLQTWSRHSARDEQQDEP